MPEPSPHCSHEGCTRAIHANTGLCIFHAPAKTKDPQEFRNALARQIRKWRREKADTWDFRGWVFVDVDRNPESQWLWEKFKLFSGAIFPVPSVFQNTRFQTYAYFLCARFKGDASFVGAEFSGDASFVGAEFSGNAFFDAARFSGDASFIAARFSGNADFDAAQFLGYASFHAAQFSGNAGFVEVRFSGDAFFGAAQFLGYASFHAAQFSAQADFHEAHFTWAASFASAQFHEQAIFERASFRSELSLAYAAFAVVGDFSECEILGHVRLHWPGEGKTRVQAAKGEEEKSLTASAEIQRGKLLLKHLDIAHGVLDLRRNSLAPDCELVIEDCDMSRVLFEGTDCTQIRFYNCAWPVGLGRAMVGDENLARPYLKRGLLRRAKGLLRVCRRKRLRLLRRLMKVHTDWSLIALTYQQLARRFREDFNHSVANDFDRGVFEMKRLMNRNFWSRWFGLAAWYRYLSNYGGSILRPVCVLAASIVAFALGYGCFDSHTPTPNCPALSSFSDYLGLSLQVTYLNRAGLEFARGNSIGVNVLMALQVVLTATLVALFVFAVRRRFKHG